MFLHAYFYASIIFLIEAVGEYISIFIMLINHAKQVPSQN